MKTIVCRGKATLDITPSWWSRGHGVDAVMSKCKALIGGLRAFAAEAPEQKAFLGMMTAFRCEIARVTMPIMLPSDMTDADVERLGAALVARLESMPPPEV